MSRSPTDQQRAAIDARAFSVALGAGAGCGKTSVLTSRFLGLVAGEDPLGLDELTAVTFTEKAAREMRERVRDGARKTLASAEGPEIERWKAIVRGLESASIRTFHGFCGEILRRYPIEAGVEPGFTVLDEAIGPTFREQALDADLRRRLADQDPDLIALAVEYGLGPLRDALALALSGRDRGAFRAWAAEDPESVVDRWIQLWETTVRPDLLGEIVDGARPLLDLLRSHEPDHPRMRERRALVLADLPGIAGSRDPIAALGAIHEAAKVQGGGASKAWSSEAVYQEIQARFKALRDAIKSFLEVAAIDRPASIEAARLGIRFARLASGAVEAYSLAKAEAGVLDFDDLVEKALGLLRDGPPAALEAIRSGCRALLVDEFQDTDPVQGEILRVLAGEAIDGGGLFLVGDLKQSIYGFRGARPEVFDEFRARFRPEGRLALNANFRSVPGVIQFVNALFAETFPGAEHALEPTRSAVESEHPPVEFVWATEPDSGERLDAAAKRKVEARWLARLIAGRLKAGWTVQRKRDEPPGRANAGDVVFLFRSMTDVATYEQALAAEGLDYHVVGGSAFYGQQEVIDLINLLTAIEDPLDEVALAGALRGPFFCVSDEALFWLASEPGGLPVGLENWRRQTHLNDRDEPRVRRAQSLLSAWRGAKDRVPIADLIDRALDESGAEAALLGEFLGDRKRANVRKLARLARRFDLQGGYTLADFVARLRADLRKPPKEEQAATAEEGVDAVRLMTIHQAKGQEFPIVVLADLDRKPEESRGAFAAHPEVGLVVRPPAELDSADDDAEPAGSGTSIGRALLRHFQKKDARDEAHRIFYVAATRAMDHLILSAGSAADDPPRSIALKLLADRFDRSSGSPTGAIPPARPEPSVSVLTEPPPPVSGGSDRRRPDLLGIASAIREAARHAPEADPGPIVSGRPSIVDLDPSADLPPYSARLDRLIRSALADRLGLDPRGVGALLTRVGRAQDPAASPALVAQALDRLEPWLRSPLARSLAKSAEIRRAVPWSVAFAIGNKAPTVFRGVIDLAYREPGAPWRLLNIADAQSSEPADRLRVLLPAHFADRLGVGPVVEAWRVRFGPWGGLRGEDRFDRDEVEHAIEEFFRATAEDRP